MTAVVTPDSTAPVDSPNTVLATTELSKCYRLYAHPQDRLKQAIIPRLQRVFGRRPGPEADPAQHYYREYWALRNISLQVKAGETVGIVGRNGSGKSTLLELIVGVLTPTSGTVTTKARIAALLELGAGFNPEFSGRDNVFLNAALMGLDYQETRERFDEIVAFSELADFIDQPLRTYSSGMFVRLAFSVAINIRPDILVIDESLSVGDEAFQRKCFSRIRAFQDAGGTILFVSHSAGAVIELCSRALFLDQGELLFSGLPRDVIAEYQKLLYAPSDQAEVLREAFVKRASGPAAGATQCDNTASADPSPRPAPDTTASYDPDIQPRSTVHYEKRGARLHDFRISTLGGRQVNILVPRSDYIFSYKIYFEKPAVNVRCGMFIKTTTGYELGGATSSEIGQGEKFVDAGTTLELSFRFKCLLTPGAYFLNAGVVAQIDGVETFLDRAIDVAMFKVQPSKDTLAAGAVDLMIEPTMNPAPSVGVPG
jgi:lipopolysaccharide transport system ATP-binding protein